MRVSQWLSPVGFLLFSLFPAHLCKICEVNSKEKDKLDPLINTMVNSNEPYPSVAPQILMALKFVKQHYSKAETTFLNQVKLNIMQCDGATSSGQFALDLLALTAACQTCIIKDYKLVKKLEQKFQAEVDNIDKYGHPLTTYYQLGLDVLAICLLNGTYSTSKIADLFSVEPKKYYYNNQFSVDTGALAVLALTCVDRKNPDVEEIRNNIEMLVKMILNEIKPDGTIGNIYSTGQAMQALFVTSKYYKEEDWNCTKTLKTVLNHIPQAFQRPIAASQVLPALQGKTYLDLTHGTCQSSPGYLNNSIPTITESTPQSHQNISVKYQVVDFITKHFKKSIEVSVPEGSFFLNVMEKAQEEDRKAFGFTTKSSEWGPYVTSVAGIEASSKDRTYWQLLNNDQPLSQGVAEFVVSKGDKLEVRLSYY
ncbi:transcobalamin-1 [Antechinus flavipes]|uniref:transcobalamin-1 n=1 Tax=Antechinus flavipes TaxID=38775 RepID=UPI0022360818|nr:transcobalamin-1 [Antechinus flavipes]